MKNIIAGYIEKSGEEVIDFLYHYDCLKHLTQNLQKQKLISSYGVGITLIDIVGFIKDTSPLSSKQNSKLVTRDLDKRLGDFKIVGIGPDSIEAEEKRDYIIPKEETVQRWQFSVEVESDNIFELNNYRIFYNEGELAKNYGQDFWEMLRSYN